MLLLSGGRLLMSAFSNRSIQRANRQPATRPSDVRYHPPVLDLFLLIIGFIVISGALALTDAALLSISFAEVEELVAHKKIGATALRAVSRRMPPGGLPCPTSDGSTR